MEFFSSSSKGKWTHKPQSADEFTLWPYVVCPTAILVCYTCHLLSILSLFCWQRFSLMWNRIQRYLFSSTSLTLFCAICTNLRMCEFKHMYCMHMYVLFTVCCVLLSINIIAVWFICSV
jgi:hypothetical protein